MAFKKPDSENPLRIKKPVHKDMDTGAHMKKIPNATEDWSHYKKKKKKM